MTFQLQSRSEYVALADNCLDAIPIEEPEDLSLVKSALQAIYHSQPAEFPTHLKGEITVIREMVDHPEQYVKEREVQPAFRMTILGCIVKKINQISIEKMRQEAAQRVRKVEPYSHPADVVIRPVRYYNILFLNAGFI